MRIHRIPLLLLVAVLVGNFPLLAADTDAEPDDYQQGNYGRVRFVDPSATLIRAAATGREGEPSRADLNSPIFPGDTLLTARDERAEVQLAGGGLVRIDGGSSVTFLALPDPYAEISDNTVLKVSNGVIRLNAHGAKDSEFRIDTPAASIYLLGDSDLRIEVMEGGLTRVVSRRGVAEVVGEGGSVLVRGGTRSRIEVGALPDSPQAFNTFADDPFDRWCSSLDDAVRDRARTNSPANGDAYGNVPEEVRPYYSELSGYGSWVSLPSYGYAWVPAGVSSGFRPYVNGYWAYGPGGYFWVSYEPWGWAPYHYGRWTWATGFGWCWLPGRVFAGAWVSWSWGSDYVGWCPLDYWNRPCFYGDRLYGHYDPHCWTFVDSSHLGYRGGYHRHAVPIQRAGDAVARNALTTRPPRISPYDLSRDPEQRDRAAREAQTGRQGRSGRPQDSTAVAPRRFDQTESEWRGRLASAAGARGDRRAAPESPRSTARPPTGEIRRTPSIPSTVGESRQRRPATPAETAHPGTPADRRERVGRPSPEGHSVAPGDRSRDRSLERPTAPRRLANPPADSRTLQPDGAIRELYRRVAPTRAVHPPDPTGQRRQPSSEPSARSAAPARPEAQPPARMENNREKAPARNSRPAQERGHSGGRGDSKHR